MTFQAHLKSNFLLVLVNDGYRQPKTNNNEIDRRARCGERRNPPSLTTALISDPGAASTRNPPGFSHGSHDVICQDIEILRVFAFGLAGSSFIIDEGAKILGRQESL